jgi:hypothetical protein
MHEFSDLYEFVHAESVRISLQTLKCTADMRMVVRLCEFSDVGLVTNATTKLPDSREICTGTEWQSRTHRGLILS